MRVWPYPSYLEGLCRFVGEPVASIVSEFCLCFLRALGLNKM